MYATEILSVTAELRVILDRVQGLKEWIERRWADYPSRPPGPIDVDVTLEEITGDLERLARFVAPEVDRLVAEEDARRVALAAGLTLSNR
jgi:hypothetical protein